MNGKRIVSAALALLLAAGMPMAALAEEYDLANGNITVSADNSGQYVSQEGRISDRYTLTHDGTTVTFLLGQQKTDIQKLLG